MAANWSPLGSPQRPGGVIFYDMLVEHIIKRAVSFFARLNLYSHAKDAFAHHRQNYDPFRLARAACAKHDWFCQSVRFVTFVPISHPSPTCTRYRNHLLTAMPRTGIAGAARKPRNRTESVRLPHGFIHEMPIYREKGIASNRPRRCAPGPQRPPGCADPVHSGPASRQSPP